MRLDELKKGESAIISQIEGDDSLTMRLYEMGLMEEEPIELIGVAPLGDPLEFSIRGYRLSLRKSEAARVQITVKAE